MKPTLILLALLLTAPESLTHAAEAPVTQEQYRQLVRVFKRVVDRLDAMEKKVTTGAGGAAAGKEEVVDLNAPSTSASAVVRGHSASKTAPNFKVYFDLNLVSRPNINDFTFMNYHSFLLFDILPTSDLQFAFDIATNPRFYELDYQVSPRLQMRFGKIWIPFDDMSPHNIFGGRVNTSKLSLAANSPFLPDLWTELGVGMKYDLITSRDLSLESHLYIVNGFQASGTDPSTNSVSGTYPNFADASITSADNNRDKAIGGRLHAKFANGKFGVGASFYTAQFNADEYAVPAQRLRILGLDGQIRLARSEIRAGLASMSVGLPSGDSFSRGGLYAEYGQKFGGGDKWKILFRAGAMQLDNRVVDITDQQIVGATLLYHPNLLEYSIETSRDIKDVPGKINNSYSAARVIIAL